MEFCINELGNNGHLGNQMFQYAFIKALAKKYNANFCIPPNEVFGRFYYQKLFSNIDECFDIKCDRRMEQYPSIRETFFHYDQELIDNIEGDHNLVGFFQSEKYFKDIETELRSNDFVFKDDITQACKEIIDEYKGSISLHIRRNDFVTNPNHPLQSNQYYMDALEQFPKDLPVLVFSDDVAWCKNQEMFSDDRFLISETENAYCDLYIMSNCDYHVMCNSTFSWWGAWLSNSKNVVAPKNWFSGDCAGHNTKDLYLPDWKLL
jgi:hypothetical protein